MIPLKVGDAAKKLQFFWIDMFTATHTLPFKQMDDKTSAMATALMAENSGGRGEDKGR